MPRPKSTKIKLEMIKAQILFSLARYRECFNLIKPLYDQINQDAKLNFDEKKYCIAYSRWLAQETAKKIALDRLESKSKVSNETLSKIDLANVSDEWKSKFPLRIHPNWKDA